MNIGIVGCGFVGLTLAMHLAQKRTFKVYGFEINQATSNLLNNGEAPFYEPGMKKLLQELVNTKFFLNPQGVFLDAVFVTVGTPIDKVTKKPNLGYVETAIQSVLPILKKESTIFLRSTVAIGLSRIIQEKVKKAGRPDVGVCFAPERTIEGSALKELNELPQIFSADTSKISHARALLKEMDFNLVEAESLEAAEAAKLLSNTYRDIKFSTANMFALICQDQGLSFNHVRDVAEYKYPRNNFGTPGFVSGPCLSKDAHIIGSTINNNQLSSFVKIGRDIEDHLLNKVTKKIIKQNRKKWLFTGLAFKGQPETSDIRDSSVVEILQKLRQEELEIFLHDFVVAPREMAKLSFPILSYGGIFEFDPHNSAIFIGNNSKRYSDDIFTKFIEMFIQNGGVVFDAWGVTNIKHERLISIGSM